MLQTKPNLPDFTELLRQEPAPARPDRVVSLFRPAEAVPGEAEREQLGEHDWMATINLIRQVSAEVRRTEESSRQMARNAQSYMHRAGEQVEEFRVRAESAETALRAAEARAQDADTRASRAEIELRESEHRAQLAQEQAATAEARAREATAWAKRLHQTIEQTFGTAAAPEA